MQNLYNAQNARCAICLQPETSKHSKGSIMKLAVDHCHITGTVRGFLCQRCNQGLGLFRDSVESLLNAVTYLDRKRL